MTRRKRKLTDDEIEAQVLSELDDPTAWDRPIDVPALNAPRPAWVAIGRHLELSARFHVLSILHRLGAEATLTLAHPNNADIIVVHASGRTLTIDVKTLVGTASWALEPFRARSHHYIAFVLFPRNAADDPTASPEVHVVPSERLQAYVQHRKKTRVRIHTLSKQLEIGDPWQQLMAEAA